jgi:hypothetical protein
MGKSMTLRVHATWQSPIAARDPSLVTRRRRRATCLRVSRIDRDSPRLRICAPETRWLPTSIRQQGRAGDRDDDAGFVAARRPKAIRVDNGPEFIFKTLNRWL